MAAKVPPNTIINGDTRNNALYEPPSNKKAPKIEKTPIAKPINETDLIFIDNSKSIAATSLPTFYKTFAERYLQPAFPLLLWLHQDPFL